MTEATIKNVKSDTLKRIYYVTCSDELSPLNILIKCEFVMRSLLLDQFVIN